MTISIHPPDPSQGAAIDALNGGIGGINQPDDNENMQAAAVRVMGQPLADWVAYLRDVKLIKGTGTPPAGGYTPTTNPIIIKGTGLRLEAPLVHSGNDAYTVKRRASVSGASPTLTATIGDVVYLSTLVGMTLTLRSTGPSPPVGLVVRLWTDNAGTGNPVTIQREDLTELCNFPADTHCCIDAMYDVGNIWRVVMFSPGVDFTGATP